MYYWSLGHGNIDLTVFNWLDSDDQIENFVNGNQCDVISELRMATKEKTSSIARDEKISNAFLFLFFSLTPFDSYGKSHK